MLRAKLLFFSLKFFALPPLGLCCLGRSYHCPRLPQIYSPPRLGLSLGLVCLQLYTHTYLL